MKQGAEGLEIGLLLQQRDEVISVAGEPSRNDFPDLPLDIIGLHNTMSMNSVMRQTAQDNKRQSSILFVGLFFSINVTSEVFSRSIP